MLDHAERAVDEMFRGAVQTAAHHYLALADDAPVGYIDCGTFDRCTVYGGEGPDGPIILETIDAVTGSIAFVVDPARRRQRLATNMIQALTHHPDLATVELFEAGVDPENQGSRARSQPPGSACGPRARIAKRCSTTSPRPTGITIVDVALTAVIVKLALTIMTAVPDLETLAAEIAADSPLAGVTAANALAERLHARADELLDVHIDRARTGGASWTEIGCALGTSKQAAQQRFAALADPADSRAPFGLPGTAADALRAAGTHARDLGHHYIGPEHLILALLDQPQELAGQTLGQLGVTPARALALVQERLGAGDPRPDGSLGVAPQTKRLLELARAVANALGHNCAKTEHVLLAAISPKLHSPAASLLAECGANADQIRDQLTRTLLREAPELAERLSNRTLFSRVRTRPI